MGIVAVFNASKSAPTRNTPWRSFDTFWRYHRKRPTRAWYVLPDGSVKTLDGAVIGNETGEFCCTSQSVTTGTSGSPVFAPALSGHETRSSTLFMKSAPVPTIAKSFWH